MSQKGLHHIAQSAATDKQIPGWDNATGFWKPRNTVHAVVAGANVTVDSTDPFNPVVAASGGGGGGGGGSTAVLSVRVRKDGTSQTFPNGAVTPITFQIEDWDPSNFWNSGAPTRFTVPAGMAGRYLVGGGFSVDSAASFDQLVSISLNGTELTASRSRTTAAFAQPQTSMPMDLVAGDYVELNWYNGSGSSKTSSATSGLGGFWMFRLPDATGAAIDPNILRLNLPLSTLTGWTAGAGTWSITSSVIRQALTANAVYRLRYSAARIPLNTLVAEADIKVDVAPNTVSSRAGFVFGSAWGSDTNGGILCALIVNTSGFVTGVNWEYDGITAGSTVTLAAPIALGTWINFRVHKVGPELSAYVNGTLVGTGFITQAANREEGSFNLYSYAADASYRNLKVWTPAQPGEAITGSVMKDRRWVVGTGETSVDEFNDNALDTAWVRADGTGAPSGNVAWTEGADVISAANAGGDSTDALHALLRPLTGAGGAMAAGDAFVTCCTPLGPLANYGFFGLMLADGATHGSGKQVVSAQGIRGTGHSIAQDTWTNFVTISTAVDILNPMGFGGKLYTRLVMLAANSFRTDVSPDGVSWIKGTAAAFTMTPTHVGFFDTSYGTATKHIASFEFLRRVAGIT